MTRGACGIASVLLLGAAVGVASEGSAAGTLEVEPHVLQTARTNTGRTLTVQHAAEPGDAHAFLLGLLIMGQWPAAGAPEPGVPARRIAIGRVDPIRLAEQDIAAGHFRVLCVSEGWGCQPPAVGARNHERCYASAARMEVLAEFGDVIAGDADLRARRRRVAFASKYNITLVRALDRLGRRSCPAGEDWDALGISVSRALRDQLPGFPYLDAAPDPGAGDYFRIVTRYPAHVDAIVGATICDCAARHGVRPRVRIAVSDRPGRAPATATRFFCEAGGLVSALPRRAVAGAGPPPTGCQ